MAKAKAKKKKARKKRAKKVKIKPMKAPSGMRGPHGRYVAKASIEGTTNINTMFKSLKKNGFHVARNAVLEIAKLTAQEVRNNIEQQSVPNMGGTKFGQPRRFSNPLHEWTKTRKAAKRQDARTLIATGAYVSAIGVIEARVGKGYLYRVAFTEKSHPGGISYEKLFRILEYGARIRVTEKMRGYLHFKGMHLKKTTQFIVIPSRPHFMPTILRVRRELRKLTTWGSVNILTELSKMIQN